MAIDQAKIQEVHDSLITIAHKAGEMILAARPSTDAAGSKKNSVDLVTETDQAVEAFVSGELKQKYPDFDFIGEETYVPGKSALTERPTFILDPIDGTTNFVHAHPYVSISLGFTVDYTPTVGIVYAPFYGTLYSAIRGHGAYLTTTFPGRPDDKNVQSKQKLPLRRQEKLDGVGNALLAIEWGSDRSGHDFQVKADTFNVLARSKEEGGAMAHSLRSFGGAALNICAVASGQLDAYWEAGPWAWDVTAGWVIAIEAGGAIVDAQVGKWEVGVESRRYFIVRGDGEEKTEEVKGGVDGQAPMKLSKGQKAFVEEFWGYVRGTLEVGQ